MTAISAKLANALNELPFVQAIEDGQQDKSISILCRLKQGTGGLWAALAEKILREAQKREGTNNSWHTHIARVYMLRENKFVYGWAFVIHAANVDTTIPIVAELIRQFGNALATNGKAPHPQNGHRSALGDDYDPPEEIHEDNDFSEPEAPLPKTLPKGYRPEADAAGNPIVPREHRVRQQAMAGLPANYDRNAPDPEKGKGSWQIEGRKGKPFRPPVRR